MLTACRRLCIGALAALALPAMAQMASDKAKFVGNVIGSAVPDSYSRYWNQVTPENASKWGVVEGTRNTLAWAGVDAAYDFAQSKGYRFKFHTFVWGSQAPAWIGSLSPAQQRDAVEQWMRVACQRYPNIWAVDVVNEPLHQPPAFKDALGGDGSTGWDWVITSFRLARQHCPKAQLLINEYGTEGNPAERERLKAIVMLLKDRGLIDGIGLQAHHFTLDKLSPAQLQAALDDYATLGLDLYISELDLTGGGSDSGQQARYEALFPVLWKHASVKGITLWGYLSGQTWADGTGLLGAGAIERPALTWLKNYVRSN